MEDDDLGSMNEQGHSQRRNVEVTLKQALKVRQQEGLQVRELATQTPETENQDKKQDFRQPLGHPFVDA